MFNEEKKAWKAKVLPLGFGSYPHLTFGPPKPVDQSEISCPACEAGIPFAKENYVTVPVVDTKDGKWSTWKLTQNQLNRLQQAVKKVR